MARLANEDSDFVVWKAHDPPSHDTGDHLQYTSLEGLFDPSLDKSKGLLPILQR
jgi:hypothetical protein